MDPSLITQTKLSENRTCFTGEIGLEGDQVAFQVNESITDALDDWKTMDSKKMICNGRKVAQLSNLKRLVR